MLAQQTTPAAQAGEEQSSHAVFATRDAHWKLVLLGLLCAARTMANGYLQEERDDVRACVDADHHAAVRDLFAQVKRAEALGLTLVGANQLAAAGMSAVDLWSVNIEPFTADSLSNLIHLNDWLRVGDVVFKADTIYRHTLTEADFKAAADQGEIGGQQ